ncbi:MAG: hypothetical protein ACR2PI_20635 [Hyphomicrobiaceae bacterium]
MRRLTVLVCVLLGFYVAGYVPAREYAFGMVEHYPAGKGGPRRDFMRAKTKPYARTLFAAYQPLIAIEVAIRRSLSNRCRST